MKSMTKKIHPYLLTSLLAAALVFNLQSCGKTEEDQDKYDPELTRLRELLVKQEDAAIAAKAIAFTQPEDLRDWYWSWFNVVGGYIPQTRRDTLERGRLVITVVRTRYGNPLPTPNAPNIDMFYNQIIESQATRRAIRDRQR